MINEKLKFLFISFAGLAVIFSSICAAYPKSNAEPEFFAGMCVAFVISFLICWLYEGPK